MKLIGREYDEYTGITEEFWYEENALTRRGKIHIKRFSDVQANIDRNIEICNSMPRNFGNAPMHLMADIPFSVIEQWKTQGFDWFNSTDNEKRRMLNNSDYAKLRTRSGRM